MTFEVAQLKGIYLRPYEEAIGVFRGIEGDDYSVSVLFGEFQVVFKRDSIEAKIVKKRLKNDLIGEKIAILRIDHSKKPIIVKVDKMRRNTPAPLILPHKGKKVT